MPKRPGYGGAGAGDGAGVIAVEMLTEAQLNELPRERLVEHALSVQDFCRQVDDDNKFLNWEFKEYNDSVTYFSRAAKLAHKLSAADVDTIATVAINELPDYFGCRFAAFFLYDDASKLLTLHKALAPMPEDAALLHREKNAEHLLVSLLFNRLHPFVVEYLSPTRLLVTDDAEELKVQEIPPEWYALLGKNAVVFPLSVRAADNREPLVLGGLVISDAQCELEAKDSEAALFYCDLLSSSLYNAKLVQQLNDLTIIEPLTQIYNRRYLISHLSSAMVQARRHRHKLSIAMLDIDHFKRFNDTYGHLCGDEVLRELASVLKDSVRADVDVPARYGGEEFMLVMPYTDLATAAEVAERVRRKIKSHTFRFERSRMSVTCSIGLAEYVYDESLEEFIDRADACLYHAKRAGRDQVCSSTTAGKDGS